MMLYGRQGAGKSSLLWQLAHALSTGAAWLGFPTAQPGRVLYLSLDMPYREFTRVQSRGELGGFPMNDNIIVNDKEWMECNIFNPRDHQKLKETLVKNEIQHLFLDTISEGYVSPPNVTDVNEEARAVIRRFQQLVPDGVFVFLKHERKEPGFIPQTAKVNERDSFSGAVGWESKPTASLRLSDADDKHVLQAGKCRIDQAGFKKMPLIQSKHGFYEAEHSHVQMLRFWPRFIPEEERFVPKSQKEVFEDIAQRNGGKVDTIRQSFNRARKQGVDFAWLSDITDG